LLLVQVYVNLSSAVTLSLVSAELSIPFALECAVLVNVLVGYVLLDGNEVQLGTRELGMSAITDLTIKQLILIRNMRALIPQQTKQLIIHLTALQYGQNHVSLQEVQNTVLDALDLVNGSILSDES